MQLKTMLNYCPDACPFLDFTYFGGDQIEADGEVVMTSPLTISCRHLKVCAVRMGAMQEAQAAAEAEQAAQSEEVEGGEPVVSND